MKKGTKTGDVLRYLKEGNKISSVDAWELFAVTRLSAIIFNLRNRGYNIITVMTPHTSKYGYSADYAVYHLVMSKEERDLVKQQDKIKAGDTVEVLETTVGFKKGVQGVVKHVFGIVVSIEGKGISGIVQKSNLKVVK